MNLAKSWTITRKDFSIFWQKKSILYSLVAFPLGVGVGLPAVLWLVARKAGVSYTDLAPITDTFAFFFMVSSASLSTALAAYSIVGEKTEKTLEPLLATPSTDGEILVGKVLAAFVPTVASTLLGAAVFMGIVDAISYPQLGYFYYPNWSIAVLLLLATPLACLFCVEVNVLVSARVTDVRAAQQLGGLLVLPFVALYLMGEIQVLTLNTPTLLYVSLALFLIDLILFPLSRATFRREEILTRWK